MTTFAAAADPIPCRSNFATTESNKLDTQAFSQTYQEARSKFLNAAAARGLQVKSYPHPLLGREGEALAIDVAWDGPANAQHIAILSSAVHGVEGFCGSAVQVHALQDNRWRAGLAGGDGANQPSVAVLYVHGVNPWGFSHLRRVTHENVDLNRNFCDFTQPLPTNPAYGELHPLLLPAQWPPAPDVQAAMQTYIATQGMPALQVAVSGGQHDFPDGLFFGGHAPTWSNQALRQVLRDFCSQARHVAWVDLHSGLGPSGVGEHIYSGHEDDPVNYARCVRWWGANGATRITRVDDGSTSSALLTGTIRQCVDTELAHATTTKITLEFGTLPVLQGLQALRAEQWLQRNPFTPEPQAAAIRKALRDYFYVDADVWKTQILQQGVRALAQMVAGLAEPAAQAESKS